MNFQQKILINIKNQIENSWNKEPEISTVYPRFLNTLLTKSSALMVVGGLELLISFVFTGPETTFNTSTFGLNS